MQDRQAWLFLNELAADSESDDLPLDLSAPHLTGRLPVMTLKQMQRILQRYSPGVRVSRRNDAMQEIRMVLASKDLLARLYAGLTPMEMQILQLLKRRGGQASGWELYTGAILRGCTPDSQAQDQHYYYWTRPPAAIEYLKEMAADGLLLIPGLLDIEHYGHTADETISADESLLTHLPLEPLPEVLKLDLPLRSAEAGEGRHPAGVVLELLDVLQLAATEGGLDVTRSGRVAKPFLKRLGKQRPHLKTRLEPLLRFLPALALVQRPADDTIKQPWQVSTEQLATFLRLPLTFMHAAIVDASPVVSDVRVESHWQDSMYRIDASQPFWNAMLQALPALPQDAVNADDAAAALWRQVIEPVFAQAGRSTSHLSPPLEAITRLLTVVFPVLGLVNQAGNDDRLILPGPAATSYLTARAILEGRSEVSSESIRQAEVELEAGGPALLMQPDFSILVYLDRLTSGAVRALSAARLERLDRHTATFSIDRTSVTYGLDSGADVEKLIARFAAHSQEVPANVAAAMNDWAARRDRLRLHVATQIIEYPGPAERDAALPGLPGARALAERFILLDSSQPARDSRHDYRLEPNRVLSVDGNGLIQVRGPLDLPARKLLKSVTERTSANEYRIIPEKVRSGAFNSQLQDVLVTRTIKRLPQALEVMLKAWSGQTPAPAFTTAALFQHPEAASWAAHPRIGSLLGQKLNAATYLIEPGKEAELKQLLDELSISHSSGGSAPDSAVAAAVTDTLETGHSTRKTRELIERAIEDGQHVELRYAYERRDRTRGKVRTEQLIPEEVTYHGSTPYLLAVTVAGDVDRVIRIGFVEAIGMVEAR